MDKREEKILKNTYITDDGNKEELKRDQLDIALKGLKTIINSIKDETLNTDLEIDRIVNEQLNRLCEYNINTAILDEVLTHYQDEFEDCLEKRGRYISQNIFNNRIEVSSLKEAKELIEKRKSEPISEFQIEKEKLDNECFLLNKVIEELEGKIERSATATKNVHNKNEVVIKQVETNKGFGKCVKCDKPATHMHNVHDSWSSNPHSEYVPLCDTCWHH